MPSVFTVYVKARPRAAIVKVRRRLKGLNRQRAKAALKYLNECLNADARAVNNNLKVQVADLIFGNDTRAVNAINKAVAILTESLASTVQFLPAQ